MSPLSSVMFCELEEVHEGDLEAAEVSATSACGLGKNWLIPEHCDLATMLHLVKQFKTIPYALSACAGCK